MVVSCTGRMVPTAVSTIGSRTRRTSATIPGALSSLAETRSACIDTLGANLPANHKRSTVTPTAKTSKIAARLPQSAHSDQSFYSCSCVTNSVRQWNVSTTQPVEGDITCLRFHQLADRFRFARSLENSRGGPSATERLPG